MKHLFFASHFEATPFILDSMNKVNNAPEVYEGEYRVIIIGTGITRSAINCSSYFEKYDISENDYYINLGIAGSVAPRKIGEILNISQVQIFCSEPIPESSKNIWQTSYPEIILNCNGKRLGTSLHPVWGSKFHTLLNEQEIDLVDMEGYSFAQACEKYSISAKMVKAISDNLTKKSQSSFLENAQAAIDSLYRHFINELK
ncbi:MAG: hypothetical protein MK132_09820 [Lentisphaerales bacterium]|nr:hypothetical protein [Lentisphaerales bacterium]